MGTVRITQGGRTHDIPVPKSCLAGRHWSCHVKFTSRTVPQFWVELRWVDNTWAWRPLNSIDDTRGSGANLSNGWRAARMSGNRPPRVSIAQDVWLDFIDVSPPQAFAQNVETNAFIRGDALEDLWECVDGRIYRYGWDETISADSAESELRDGDLVSSGGSLYRVFCSEEVSAPTLLPQLKLLVSDSSVTIDVERLVATFESSQASARVVGECVRVLAAYALTRRDEHFSEGGWLTANESYQRWLDLGGNPSSNIDRLGFERGKLRNQLRKAGVLDVKALFDRQTSGYRTTLRLSLNPDQIFMVEDE